MNTELLDIIACPICKGPLDLEAEGANDAGEILVGTLTCALCGERYPIAGGIPNLLPPALRDAETAVGR